MFDRNASNGKIIRILYFFLVGKYSESQSILSKAIKLTCMLFINSWGCSILKPTYSSTEDNDVSIIKRDPVSQQQIWHKKWIQYCFTFSIHVFNIFGIKRAWRDAISLLGKQIYPQNKRDKEETNGKLLGNHGDVMRQKHLIYITGRMANS